MGTQRLHGLDFLRALMMSLGVVLHSAQIYLTIPATDYNWDPARSQSMDVLLFFINTFRMPVFFLLSGFFTAMLLDRRGARAMLQNRLQRIVIPFLVFLPPLAIMMTLLRIVATTLSATGSAGFDPSLVENTRMLWDNTHNLWFLYYLTLYLGTVFLALQGWPRLPVQWRSRCRRFVMQTPLHSMALFLPLCLLLAALGSVEWSGRISAKLSFVPSLSVYLYFGICFLAGWLLYQRLPDLDALGRCWARNMLLATVLFAVALVTVLTQGEPGTLHYSVLHPLLSLVTGFSIGYYVLAFVGLFSRHCRQHNAWIRYFSDSAYWIFILHSVPLVIIAMLLHSWSVPAELKFLVVSTATLGICLLSYQLWVRNGRIGQILNGRRYSSAPWQTDGRTAS